MATKEGIVEIGGRYYYYNDTLPQPFEVEKRLYPLKIAVIEEEITGYDSTSTERYEWKVFEDEGGNKYSVREGKTWVREADEVERTSGDVVEITYHVDPDVDEEHEFAAKHLDI